MVNSLTNLHYIVVKFIIFYRISNERNVSKSIAVFDGRTDRIIFIGSLTLNYLFANPILLAVTYNFYLQFFNYNK